MPTKWFDLIRTTRKQEGIRDDENNSVWMFSWSGTLSECLVYYRNLTLVQPTGLQPVWGNPVGFHFAAPPTLWQGAGSMKRQGKHYIVPTTTRWKILQVYHDSPESDQHDDILWTYKLCYQFTWPWMRRSARLHHNMQQMPKVENQQTADQMILPIHSKAPVEVIHLDFTELWKSKKEQRHFS